MYYGELSEHSEQYQCGHASGASRAYDDAIHWFEEVLENEKPHTKHETTEIIAMLRYCKLLFLQHCETFGMGIEETENRTD